MERMLVPRKALVKSAQVIPESVLRNTSPANDAAYSIDEFIGSTATLEIGTPLLPERSVATQEMPPSLLR
jgi:hypothetical protein